MQSAHRNDPTHESMRLILQVQLLEDGGVFKYSTAPENFITGITSIFDKGITAHQAIPQLEPQVHFLLVSHRHAASGQSCAAGLVSNLFVDFVVSPSTHRPSFSLRCNIHISWSVQKYGQPAPMLNVPFESEVVQSLFNQFPLLF